MEEILNQLQCQFTWDFEIEDKLNCLHILTNVEMKINYTHYRNHSILYNFKAFILQKQDRSKDALESLRNAENIIRRDFPSTVDRHILATYGNYAWIYYHLDDFCKMDVYLNRIREICANIQGSEYSVETAEMYAEKGWSYWASGQRNGVHATRCFERALEMSPNDESLHIGLAFSISANFWHTRDLDVGHDAISLLEQIVQKDPENWEAVVELHITLIDTGEMSRGLTLVENDLPNCCNPAILRKLAITYKKTNPERAIRILNRGEMLTPDYHLLLSDFGDIYFNMLKTNTLIGQERENILSKAMNYYARAIELQPSSVFSRLRMAHLYGERGQTELQEFIYKRLENQVPNMSEKSKANLWYRYGEFKSKFRQYEDGIELYKRGYSCSPRSFTGLGCKKGLEWHIRRYTRQGDIQKAKEISSFLNDN
ncbi:interferon-induced protein with tetratricopeptide repeats 5-like isoform X1 [Phyllobates terribilis]|uniref:interferon-induced protein with tetratricopeptide repeats 5-like isoform X1 n=1 Tax=Phyllobates terribilis TaxID=111132 RepID=UPI003CCAFB00